MSLQSKLDAKKAEFKKEASNTVLKTMEEATAALEERGLAEDALGVGEKFPTFELPNHEGETVTLSSLLQRGPLVVTVYRGVW